MNVQSNSKGPMSMIFSAENVFINSIWNHNFDYLRISSENDPMKAKHFKNWKQMSQLLESPCKDWLSIISKVNRIAMWMRLLSLQHSILLNNIYIHTYTYIYIIHFHFKAMCDFICLFSLESYEIWTGSGILLKGTMQRLTATVCMVYLNLWNVDEAPSF